MTRRAAMAPDVPMAAYRVLVPKGIKNPHRTQAMQTPDDAPGCTALTRCRRRMARKPAFSDSASYKPAKKSGDSRPDCLSNLHAAGTQ